MAPVVLFVLLALPFVEIWVAIQVASAIGVGWTLMLLLAMSCSGVVLTKREGMGVWRRATAEMAEGRVPTSSLLDAAMVLLGGICLTVPGFVTGIFGVLLLLPPVRALLRPALAAWAARRVAKAASSGRLGGMYFGSTTFGSTTFGSTTFGSTVGADGQRRTHSGDMSEVIDAEGWDIGGDPLQRPLPRSGDDPRRGD